MTLNSVAAIILRHFFTDFSSVCANYVKMVEVVPIFRPTIYATSASVSSDFMALYKCCYYYYCGEL